MKFSWAGIFLLLFILSRVVSSPKFPFKFKFSFREYNIRSCHEFLHQAGGWTNVAYISFTKRANEDSIRKAVHEAMYVRNTEALIFENLPPQNFPYDVFEPFYFSCLDFSRISYIDHRYSHLDTISGALPCSTLVLPKGMKNFWFYSRCDDLSCLAIPSPELAHAHLAPECGCNETVPIKVRSGFAVLVPQNLLNAYRSDEKWSSLLFTDENDNKFHVEFLPYYGS